MGGAGYGLLQGLTSAVGGYGAGQEAGAARVRQMQQDALQKSLIEANVGELASKAAEQRAHATALGQPQKEYASVSGPQGTFLYDVRSGTAIKLGGGATKWHPIANKNTGAVTWLSEPEEPSDLSPSQPPVQSTGAVTPLGQPAGASAPNQGGVRVVPTNVNAGVTGGGANAVTPELAKATVTQMAKLAAQIKQKVVEDPTAYDYPAEGALKRLAMIKLAGSDPQAVATAEQDGLTPNQIDVRNKIRDWGRLAESVSLRRSGGGAAFKGIEANYLPLANDPPQAKAEKLQRLIGRTVTAGRALQQGKPITPTIFGFAPEADPQINTLVDPNAP